MHGLEHDNGNCSYGDYKLFLLNLNGPANGGRFFLFLDSVHFPALWESSCSLFFFFFLFSFCSVLAAYKIEVIKPHSLADASS